MTESGKKNIFSSLFSNKKNEKSDSNKKRDTVQDVNSIEEINKLQRIITSKFIIDPSTYDFALSGGPIHTSLIVASAKYNQSSGK